MVRQAYFRRSRQLPNNIANIVATLKDDLTKHLKEITVEKLDLAITTATLNNDEPLSPAFFFAAAKRQCPQKTNTHNWDGFNEDLAYWTERRDWYATHHMVGSPKHREACEKVEQYTQGDTEQDTINLLDTCASMLARMDEAEANGKTVIRKSEFKGVVVELPAFNSRREFEYLKLRGQVTPQTAASKLTQALEAVNAERIASQHPRIRKEDALKDPDVVAQCRRLAVLDWLRACNISETTPSAVLMPLADDMEYQQLRNRY